MSDKKLVTDMNARERGKYADQFDALQGHAVKASAALRDEDDAQALAAVLIFALTWNSMQKELLEIFQSATTALLPADASELEAK